jgi:RNA polymerase sigma-70 factor (ECF subfamily)
MTPRNEHSGRRFETSQWSIAMLGDASRAADAQGALVQLCLRYWYPVYAYIRQYGHAPAIAQDIARSFLQYLFEHFRDEKAAAVPGQFRRYLLSHLHSFLIDDWHSVVTSDVIAELAVPPADLELRNANDNAHAESPEEAYQQSFAIEVVTRALAGLRREARDTDRLDMYEALESFIACDPVPSEYVELARHLHSQPFALVEALKRLRQRFRELVGAELADLVASPEELVAERHALHAALRRNR